MPVAYWVLGIERGRRPRVIGVARRSTVAVLVVALSGAGCGSLSTPGSRMILPSAAERLVVPDDEVFLMASPLHQPLPGLARAPRAGRYCIEFVIEAGGGVGSVRRIHDPVECPEGAGDHGVAEVMAAVGRWQFIAAAICRFPPGVAKNDDCSGQEVVIEPIPVRVAYVFDVSPEDGLSLRRRVRGRPP